MSHMILLLVVQWAGQHPGMGWRPCLDMRLQAECLR
jgi:hypothetical protein